MDPRHWRAKGTRTIPTRNILPGKKAAISQPQHGYLDKRAASRGKTEIQKQIIWDLIKEEKTDPKQILYLSFDDVQIQSEKPEQRARFVQNILDSWAKGLGFNAYDEIRGKAYCFFDEVQSVKG